MRIASARFLLPLAVLFLALVWVLRTCGGNSPAQSQAPRTGSSATSMASPAPLPKVSIPEKGRVALGDPASVKLSFHDRLSGDLLPASAQLSFQSGGRELRGDDLILSLRDTEAWSQPGASWIYSIPSPKEPLLLRKPVRAFPPDQDGKVLLPYSSGVRGKVLGVDGAPMAGAKVTAYSFSTQELQEMIGKYGAEGMAQMLDPLMFLLLRYRDEYGEAPRTSCVTDAGGSYSIVLASVGTVYLQVTKADIHADVFHFEAEPGSWKEKDFVLETRPVVEGTVYSEMGVPLEGVRVRISVSADPASADLSPEDQHNTGMAMAQVSVNGQPPRLFGALSVRTDAEGHYEAIVPLPDGIAVLAVHQDAYAVQIRESLPPHLSSPIHVDLKLRAPQQIPVIRVLGDHEPLVGAVVLSSITGDPWMLQFPHQTTDEKGEVRLPWLVSAQHWGVFVKSKRLRKTFFTFLDQGQEVIDIDADKLKPKLGE